MIDKEKYDGLKLDVLRNLLDDRGIPNKGNKQNMIDLLLLDDNGKFIKETLYEKDGDKFRIGIDIKNHTHLVQIGKLVEKKEAGILGRFAEDRVWYWSSQKLV